MDDFERELAQATEQRSDLWRSERNGLFTASENYRLMSDSRSKSEPFSDGAYTYILEKLAEDITGEPHFTPETFDTKWGTEQEPIARNKFAEQLDGLHIEEPGFYPYEMNGKKVAGASPDGIVVEAGLTVLPLMGVEIKCPSKVDNHLAYCLIEDAAYLKKNHKNHYWQIMTGLLVTGLPKWFFVSYHPKAKGLELFSILIERNDEDIEELEKRIWNAFQEKELLKKQLCKA
jgi:hypothetical protein